MTAPRPEFAYRIWCNGAADLYCADDVAAPTHPALRLFWKLRGNALMLLFGWWRYA